MKYIECKFITNMININQNVSIFVGIPLPMPLFAKLWYEIYQTENVDRKYMSMLCDTHLVVDYIYTVMLDERASLNNSHIYQFFVNFFPKVKAYDQSLRFWIHDCVNNTFNIRFWMNVCSEG